MIGRCVFKRQKAFLWAPNVFLFSSTSSFSHMSQIQCRGLLQKNKEKETRFFNFTFHGIDDFLSLNNSKFCEFDDNIHPFELEYRLPHIQLDFLHIFLYISKLTVRLGEKQNITTKEM
jgi:hypothetical protein